MITAKVQIKYTSAETLFCHPLPKGASGLKVAFEFNDPFWNTLSKTAVFRNNTATIDAVVIDDCAIIPHELLVKVNEPVYVGIYGTDTQNNLAIPILWATLGDVCSASNPSGESSAEPTFPYWAQIQEQVNTLQKEMMSQEDLENALLDAKESGMFDGPQGPKGEQGEPGIPGAAGKDGYTPITGKDYWTQEEKNEMTANAAYMAAEKVQLYSDIVCNVSGSTIVLEDTSEKKLHKLRIYGKTTQNGTPTPDAPVPLESVGDSGSVNVTVCGKNLLKNTAKSQTINGVTFTVNEDGSVTANGTASSEVNLYVAGSWENSENILPITNGNVICSGSGNSKISQYIVCKMTQIAVDHGGRDISLNITDGITGVLFRVFSGVSVSNLTFYPMVRLASITDATYEPYKAQPLPISTPVDSSGNSLHLSGIPVTSGGNYIDENGQQWICNEVDFEKGVYVQRVKTIIADGSSDEGWYEHPAGMFFANMFNNATVLRSMVGLCSHAVLVLNNSASGNVFGVGGTGIYLGKNDSFKTLEEMRQYLSVNPFTFEVVLLEENHIPLTDEERAQYADLHSNYPNTTIFNDGGAGMEVKYVADTKNYIDRKFSLLVTNSNNA